MEKSTLTPKIMACYLKKCASKKRQDMRRSKLEIEIDILKILEQRGPLKLTHLMYKTNLNCGVLKKNLIFLIKQDLIEERNIQTDRLVYSITGLGLTLLKSWRGVNQLLPAVENENNGKLPFKNTVSIRA